jgi:hypothetical protein
MALRRRTNRAASYLGKLEGYEGRSALPNCAKCNQLNMINSDFPQITF